jgi:regulatory protein
VDWRGKTRLFCGKYVYLTFMIKKYLAPDQAWQKIKHFCAYQERSHQETKDRLYGYGLSTKDVDVLLSKLIEEDYLNETRFATLFAGGHFRTKNWGRVKIAYELKQKRVSAYNIKAGLATIEEEAYEQTIDTLAIDKWEKCNKEVGYARQAKVMQYLVSRGFESGRVQAAIAKIKAGLKENS